MVKKKKITGGKERGFVKLNCCRAWKKDTGKRDKCGGSRTGSISTD